MTYSSNVYVLSVPRDELPEYRGFDLVDESSVLGHGNLLDDFRPVWSPERGWTPPRFSDKWKAVRVTGNVSPANDFPCVASSLPVFSERAVCALGEMLTSNGELLQLIAAGGTYFAFNATTVVDALDRQGSRMRGQSVFERYSFVPERLQGRTLFKIPQDSTHLYVTQHFADRVQEAALQGLDLIPVWPLPPGAVWWRLEKETRQARREAWERRDRGDR
jgi:hypothetical protein